MHFLSKYEEDIHLRFIIPFILKPVDLSLKRSKCIFDNKYFLQLQANLGKPKFGKPKFHEIKPSKQIETIETKCNLQVK